MYTTEHVTLNLSVLATLDDDYPSEPVAVFQYRWAICQGMDVMAV
jgi:hypothetical protein